MPPPKPNLRVEFRKKELQRAMDSASLAEKFRTLRSLTVELTYVAPGGTHQSGQMKYKVNLENARSVFRFDCANRECICGDHELTEALAEAVAGRRKIIAGETTCQGWRSKGEINRVRCLSILRYRFVLGYS